MIDHPVYTHDEARTRETFLALMWSSSYPGRAYEVSTNGADAFQAIGDTLLDLETSFYSPDNAFALYLRRSGARSLSPDLAAYHFYPVLDSTMLGLVKMANVGTLMYPDQSATLFIGCALDVGTTYRLEGPGIPPGTTRTMQVSAIPNEFWELRARAIRYPRGWDVYLVDENRVVGIPRTTKVTMMDTVMDTAADRAED